MVFPFCGILKYFTMTSHELELLSPLIIAMVMSEQDNQLIELSIL